MVWPIKVCDTFKFGKFLGNKIKKNVLTNGKRMRPRLPFGIRRMMGAIKSLSIRHNSGESVPTSNLVCIEEVAIRTTFCHMINIAGIFHYTCSLVIDIQCTRYKRLFFNELCVKITKKKSNGIM